MRYITYIIINFFVFGATPAWFEYDIRYLAELEGCTALEHDVEFSMNAVSFNHAAMTVANDVDEKYVI